jgi:hypothetical protein
MLASVYGAAAAFYLAGNFRLVPQSVESSSVQEANALMGLCRSLTNVIGPATSGVLVALSGAGWVFAIDGATSLVSAVSLALLRVTGGMRAARRQFLVELAEGLAALLVVALSTQRPAHHHAGCRDRLHRPCLPQ